MAKVFGNAGEVILNGLKQYVEEVQNKQFPTATTESKLKHLNSEVAELLASPYDRMEYADCFMLLIGAADKARIDYNMLLAAIEKKLAINKKRKWGKPNKNGVINHIKQ